LNSKNQNLNEISGRMFFRFFFAKVGFHISGTHIILPSKPSARRQRTRWTDGHMERSFMESQGIHLSEKKNEGGRW